MDDQTRYVRKDVMNTMLDEDLILFDAEAGKYFATSEVGAAIWAHLAEPLTIRDLCARLAEEYEVDPVTCLHDTEAFVHEVSAAGLLETT